MTRSAFATGPYYVSALLEGISWTGTFGTAATVNYSFGVSREGGALLNSTQQAAALSVLQLYANVANINFVATSPSDAQLTFSSAELGAGVAGLATTFFSGTQIARSEAQVDDDETAFSPGGYGYLVFLHEVGHTLGLKHSGNFNGTETPPFLPPAEDSTDTTVMSYDDGSFTNDSNNIATTPMLYDIAAVQYLYGANTSFNAGNTTYTISGATQSRAIWDGGGIDMFDASAHSGLSTIDLREGFGHVTDVGSSHVWAAFGANIENAAAGAGNSTIHGNALANQLSGGGGNDVLHGHESNDLLFGGVGLVDTTDGNDELYGEAGSDQIYGNSGNDTLFGGVGIFDNTDAGDSMFGGKGADQLFGNAGNDELYGGGGGVDPLDAGDVVYGGAGTDLVLGNGGGDTLFGGGSNFNPTDGADTMQGGAGDDILYGNGGNDFMEGNTGNDSFLGGAGDDTYHFGHNSGVDSVVQFDGAGSGGGDIIRVIASVNGSALTSAAALLAAVSYSSGNAIVDLGGGHSVTILGIGDGALIASDFSIG